MAERKSRIEQILQYALGRESSLPPQLSRVESLLIELIDEIDKTEGKTVLSIGGRVDTVEELPADAEEGSLYFVGYVSSADKAEYIMTSTGSWEMLGFSTLVTDSDLSSTSANPVMNRVVKAALDSKVEIIIGKQLSTEDFTTAEKTKLANLENYDDTLVLEGLDGKVDKVTGMGLSKNNYTDEEKTKLAGLENYDDSAVRSQIGKLADAGAKNKLKINTESRAIFISDLMNTVTCSGTSDGNAFINLNYVDDSTVTIPPGNWVVVGFGDMSHLRFRYTENEAAAKATGEYGSPLRFTVPSSGVTLNYLRLENKEAGQVFDNVVLKIMLCTAEDYGSSPEFVPYAPTNRELYEMILALQNN